MARGAVAQAAVFAALFCGPGGSDAAELRQPPPPPGIEKALASFFSMFAAPSCKDWTAVFAEDGTLLHPAFASSFVGREALAKFCEDNQAHDRNFKVATGSALKQYHSQWRQDGPYLYTACGGGASAVLLPYVYSTLRAQADGSFSHYSNSGWEVLQLRQSGPADVAIELAAEFWSRTAQNFTFDPDHVAARGPAEDVAQAIDKALTGFFSLFEAPDCAAWAALFAEGAGFRLPAFPDGVVGRAALAQLCEDNQASDRNYSVAEHGKAGVYHTQFRQDGPYKYTESGGLHNVLVSYVYSTVRQQPDGSFGHYSNSGVEFVQLRPRDGASDSLELAQVLEFWTRFAQPFSFDNQSQALALPHATMLQI